MAIELFRKKPVVIEALQWKGNLKECHDFLGDSYGGHQASTDCDEITVKTLEGQHTASLGDWLIKGVAGELYPCKPDIFNQTYEPVE